MIKSASLELQFEHPYQNRAPSSKRSVGSPSGMSHNVRTPSGSLI